MAKLPKKFQFIDLSDYGRPAGRWIAKRFQHTSITPIDVTTMFIICGFIAIGFMLNEYYITAAFFIILKSILDAADGELSRLKNTPSYIGRYYDSIADILLNFCFLSVFCYISESSVIYMLIAFIGIQLQGTVYNYYYVILRNSVNGDSTSRIIEDCAPKALPIGCTIADKSNTLELSHHSIDQLESKHAAFIDARNAANVAPTATGTWQTTAALPPIVVYAGNALRRRSNYPV